MEANQDDLSFWSFSKKFDRPTPSAARLTDSEERYLPPTQVIRPDLLANSGGLGAWVYVLIGVVLCLVVGVVGYLLYKRYGGKNSKALL